MPAQRFNRQLGKRRFNKIFVVAAEGKNTERIYFGMFNDRRLFLDRDFVVQIVRSDSDSAPPRLLDRMKAHVEREKPDPPFEAWLVVDKDNWTDDQLAVLCKWAHGDNEKRFLALSNPKFEYWLLLHCEEGDNMVSGDKCSERLTKCHIGYDSRHKTFDVSKITLKMVEDAVRRAKKRDNPPSKDWPRQPGSTTVYRLVEKMLALA
jgi:hypothetical protein